MIAIYRRELQAYFHTPAAYVFMGVFLLLASVMYYLQILIPRSGDLLTFMGQCSYLWMLLCPVLTMRLFAEERQKKTDQLLFTSPVSLSGIILGKYLAAITVMALTVLLTLVYVLVVAIFGQVFVGEMLVGYFGFLLQGAAFIALDLLATCLCASQMAAAVLAFGLNLLFWMMDLLVASVPDGVGKALSFLSLYTRHEPFLMGQLSFAAIIYDLSFAAVCLLLCAYVTDMRKYRGA